MAAAPGCYSPPGLGALNGSTRQTFASGALPDGNCECVGSLNATIRRNLAYVSALVVECAAHKILFLRMNS